MTKGDNISKINIKQPLKIIYSSTPLRINDIGGWTDTWYSGQGNVLNTAISPRVRVQIKVYDNKEHKRERVLVRAENYGQTFRFNPEEPDYKYHPLLQAAINSMPIPNEHELEISIISHIPAGSSTGTSASVCVALLGGLDSLAPPRHNLKQLASLAHQVETEKLKLESGIQDQVCAAYGGICFIHIYQYPLAQVTKLKLDKKTLKNLEQRLCLIYLGKAHSSSRLHEQVISSLKRKDTPFKFLRQMSSLALQARDSLQKGDLKSLGKIMVENNECQRSLHPQLIPEEADSVIKVARKYKAEGWKINGAGGPGGSLTILASKESKERQMMLEAIDSLGRGIKHIPTSLALAGLRVWQKLL